MRLGISLCQAAASKWDAHGCAPPLRCDLSFVTPSYSSIIANWIQIFKMPPLFTSSPWLLNKLLTHQEITNGTTGRRGKRITARAEEKKWCGRIMAEEVDEGKRPSVQTFKIPRKEKKKCNYVAQLSEAQTVHKLVLVLSERCDEFHPAKKHLSRLKHRVMLFFFSFCWRTLVFRRLVQAIRRERERRLQDWQNDRNSDPTSKVNCKLPAPLF